MQIRSLALRDSQLYKCLGSNEFGSSEKLIKLIVLNVPERPVNLRARDIWSRSVLVSWSAGSASPAATSNMAAQPGASGIRVSNFTVQFWRKTSGSPVGQWPGGAQNHRRESLTVDGLQNSALLPNLQPALTYEVSVIAANQVGQSEPSETIQVSTSEEEPSAPPTDVQVDSFGGATIRVMWKVPPIESLNGKLLGFYVGYRPRASAGAGLMMMQHVGHQQQQQLMPVGGALQLRDQLFQQQQSQLALNSIQQPAPIYSFKTADAIESLQYYETFLSNLKHASEYEVTVRAFNKAGSGPDCHVLVARTGPPGLPSAPNLHVQRVTGDSVSLKWTAPPIGRQSAGQRIVQQQLAVITHLHYELFYQVLGERDWYQLSVGQQQQQQQQQLQHELQMTGDRQSPADVRLSRSSRQSGPVTMPDGSLSFDLTGGSELAPVNAHTLANLQSGLTYRIYVAAANELGLGDPSNVITVKIEPSWSSGHHHPGGSAHLDGNQAGLSLGGATGSTLGANLLEALTQPRTGLFYTLVSSLALLAALVSLVTYFVWQRRLRCKYNSSSASSSYPSSWTPAASDTIQSEYSIKRLAGPGQLNTLVPSNNHLNHATTIQRQAQQQQQPELYDEVECVATQHPHHQQLSRTATMGNAFKQPQQQMQQFSTAARAPANRMELMRSSTASRPVLSSHYHQPAGLIGLATASGGNNNTNNNNNNSATLQFGHSMQQFASGSGSGGQKSAQAARHSHHHQFKTASSTLNRHHNRQLPPIPYSTMSVPKDQQQQQQQPQTTAALVSAGGNRQPKAAGYAAAAAAASGQCGSQTPLIYGVIE